MDQMVDGPDPSALPLLLWMTFSPGFQMTLESVLNAADVEGTPVMVFLDELWRDLTVAAIRWQPAWTGFVGYLWLPLQRSDWLTRSGYGARIAGHGFLGWYLSLLSLVPCFSAPLSSATFHTLRAFHRPGAFFILMTMGILRLWTMARLLGAAGALTFVGVCFVALIFDRTDYTKSEYREMSATSAHIGPQDAVLIESPRQHLTARYYLDDTFSAGIPLLSCTRHPAADLLAGQCAARRAGGG